MARQMKKVILLSLLGAMMCLQVQAQINPQEGYVITNDNDTIYGTIDYLTDEQNVKQCLFQRKGETEFKSLSPSDIKGYRLAGNGIYYVSRKFDGENGQELLFAEFLIQGGVSLYRYYHDYCNYFGFVDIDGKEIIMRDDKLNDDLLTYNKKLQERRQKVQEVNALMSHDNTIANRLWKMDLTSEDLTKMVKRYDEQYCEAEGDCIVFQYDKKKAATVSHRFYVGAGISYASYSSPDYGLGHAYDLRCSEYNYSGVAPTFLVGADLHFPRFSRYMNAQVELSYTPHRYTASDVTQEGSHPKLTTNELAGRIGISYVFCPEARIKPFLQGGLNISLHTGMKEENVSYKYRIDSNTEVINRVGTMDHGKATKLGIYLGGGIDISHIRISAMWRKAMGGGAIEKGCGILSAAYLF